MIKNKISLNTVLLIFFTIITLITFFFIFIQYKKSKEILIQSYIDKYSLQTLQIKEKFKNVFDRALYKFKTHEDIDLQKLYMLPYMYDEGKIDLKNASKIINFSVKKGYYEIFVINRDYKIVDGTYKPDIGYDLGKFPAFKKVLDEVFSGKKDIDISYIHLDIASMNLKKYYLILSPDKKYLLQLAYVVDIYGDLKKIYKKVQKTAKKINIYFVDKYMIYKIDMHRRYQKKEPVVKIYQNSFKILKKITDRQIKNDRLKNRELFDYVVAQFKKHQNMIKKLDLNRGVLTVYTIINSIFDRLDNRVIIEAQYDISKLNRDLKILLNNLLITFGLLVLIILLLYIIIIHRSSQSLIKLVEHMKKNRPCYECSSFIKEINELNESYNNLHFKLNREIEKNKNLLELNKRFILDTIHQIRTPLNVIMLNMDLLKLEVRQRGVEEIIEEIDAAVAMLTNSYEDLAYLSSNNTTITYKPSNIDISEILKSRIEFFSTIAKVNDKKIIYDIQEGIEYYINRIEFERIVDNNISNAIKYSLEEEIYISLKKEGNKIVLKFASYGEKIKEPKKIFNKNYREQTHKRGLGLGLNIVKNICDKYAIKYRTYYEDEKNIFEYVFKV